jgi:tRNA(Arg) A34 adenosine deaminase TadA
MGIPAVGPLPAAPFDDRKAIEDLMKKSGRELLSVDFDMLADDEQRRHRPYIFLLMRLVRRFWNGNRYGLDGAYAYRDKQQTNGLFDRGEEYKGHNIAAVAVDGAGKVIDFDFNHNAVFRSSIEHAEARLLRRIYNLTGLRAGWSLGNDAEDATNQFGTTLGDVTIYTSLEPCAQCAGIMALARIKEVVYLQADDGARRAANVIYNLKPYSASLKPISSRQCGVDFGERLNQAYEDYKRTIVDARQPAFFVPHDPTKPPERSTSLATFLCTDAARDLFDQGELELAKLNARPDEQRKVQQLTPAEVLKDIDDFFGYASKGGYRGTPH